MRAVDLTGKRFGRLTVLRLAEPLRRPSGVVVRRWECLCDCGKTVFVATSNLTNGGTSSCGCYRSETSRANGESNGADLVGRKFGEWTVVHRAHATYGNSNKYATGWICRNECGDERFYTTTALLKGNVAHFKEKGGSCRRRRNASLIGRSSSNTSGCVGVSYRSSERKWVAYIGDHGKTKFLGRFKTYEEAVAARKKAEEVLE